MPTVIDLFCGVGGLTHGLRLAGLNVAAGIDLDASCQYAYERNNAGTRFIAADVSALTPNELPPEKKVVALPRVTLVSFNW
jgi:DNA (cytosine-5)-methyltransferase 1